MKKYIKGTLRSEGRILTVVLLIVGSIFSLSSLSSSFVFLISDAQTNSTSASTAAASSQATKPEVTITYPDANQTLPTGTLAMFGTSSDNATARCLVSALLNDERPYQNVTATGPASGDDYSKWTFTFDPYYTLVKPGSNEIVAKIVCQNDGGTNSTAFNKMNVTGAEPEEVGQ
jgi:hypothetical protein